MFSLRVYVFFQAIMVLEVILSRSPKNCPSNSAGSAFTSRLERESEQIQASGNGDDICTNLKSNQFEQAQQV